MLPREDADFDQIVPEGRTKPWRKKYSGEVEKGPMLLMLFVKQGMARVLQAG